LADDYLTRYTDIPALIYLLRQRVLTLLDPGSWDDRNDAHFLDLYKQKKGAKSVLALCFSQGAETYHHWRVFANGSSGVAIHFERAGIVAAIQPNSKIQHGPVTYLKLADFRETKLRVSQLPFRKRFAYAPEKEYRLVYVAKRAAKSKLDVPIVLPIIRKVTLSPWMPQTLSVEIKTVLRSIRGCSKLAIVRSTLISSEEWKRLGNSAT
jgi:hypothetical protein